MDLIKNKIIVRATEEDLDKMQIALTIRDSTYGEELHCILLDEGILKDCEGCNLEPICKALEKIAQDYLIETTKVVSSFSFH